MATNPIPALQSLGYTKREAAFLYLVAAHSGYFVRRQFDYFIDRVAGAIAQNFLEKARGAGHIEIIEYQNGYRVYHLFAKPIYRLLGNPESQNRRRKGDAAIRARLIVLDFVLENENSRFLESEEERFEFFAKTRAIPQKLFTDGNGQVLPLLRSIPISLADREHSASSLVCFLFADEALITIEKFKRFLSVAGPLLRAIRNFEMVYASNSRQNFAEAQREFRKNFFPRHVDDRQSSFADWRNNSQPPARNEQPLQAKFITLLYKFSYPKIRRKDGASLSASRPSKLLPESEVTRTQADSTSSRSDAG